MTDHLTENARLRAALEAMLHAVCGETGFASAVRLVSGLAYPWPALDDAEANARAALAAPAPDAVQEAARVLLSLSNEAAQSALDACHGHYGQVAVKEFLHDIAGGRT